MDKNLPGNHFFQLNEDSFWNNDEKLYVFVKLTDSCMKTIENSIKFNRKSNIKLNIHGGVKY